MVTYIRKEFKTALNKLKFPDSWFWARYTTNPYSGCEHRCIYCDARSERYYLSQDFEEDIIIKIDNEKKLDQRIKNARTLLPDVIGPGGVCDAYQPIEKKAENTRKLLKIIKKHRFPINIATKSALITRDIDILNQIGQDTWCTIGFSITTTDQDLASFLEPYSATPQERFKAMKKIKQRAPNIQIGTYFMPIIPYLEDHYDNLEDVIKQSKANGAEFILFAPGMTLRDSQKEFFFKKLTESKYSDTVKPLKQLYQRGYNSKEYTAFLMDKNEILLKLCQKYDLNIRVKRWIPSDYRRWNYKISEILLNKEYNNAIKGSSDKTMKWAGLNLNNLDESIIEIYRRGELSHLKNFDSRIIHFITPFLEKGINMRDKKTLDKFL